jgi:hypothetical protein
MSTPKSRLFERVEVFSRATTDAINKAISEVLDARSPWQLLYRLSRIVFLGLVLYLGWILVVVQPDLAKRLMLPTGQSLAQRYGLHREQVQTLLRSAIAAQPFGLNNLVIADWDGAATLQVLAAEGRTPQLPLQPGQEALVNVAMAKVLGHAALGLCESERPLALNLNEAELPKGATLMICPIGCTAKARPTGLLVALYDRPSTAALPEPLPAGNALAARELLQRHQREQLMLLARRLGQLLEGA